MQACFRAIGMRAPSVEQPARCTEARPDSAATCAIAGKCLNAASLQDSFGMPAHGKHAIRGFSGYKNHRAGEQLADKDCLVMHPTQKLVVPEGREGAALAPSRERRLGSKQSPEAARSTTRRRSTNAFCRQRRPLVNQEFRGRASI